MSQLRLCVALPLVAVLAAFVSPVVARSWSYIVDKLDTPEERIARARRDKEGGLRARFVEIGVRYPAKRLFFRAFKRDRELEMWAGDGKGPMRLVRTYRIAAASGALGPKRREGDLQVPEGFYVIDRFNPRSNFHLSLGLNYPNASDRIRSDKTRPGSDIFIHGGQSSIGCLAMTDPVIREIYVCALDAGRPIAVQIFPTRMGPREMKELEREHADRPDLLAFWRELLPVYQAFEGTKTVPVVTVGRGGEYRLAK